LFPRRASKKPLILLLLLGIGAKVSFELDNPRMIDAQLPGYRSVLHLGMLPDEAANQVALAPRTKGALMPLTLSGGLAPFS